jgi:glycosyltransferase involved in cell wall biosynthesis
MRLIEPESPEDAARAVREIVENPPLRSKLESGALALAAGFTWDRIAERTVDFFSSLLREDR